MELSNVELMLLEIICEQKEISGYEINQLVITRGYKEWAEIGTTSIYVGLNKLNEKQLATSFIATSKQGKGPLPRKFRITPTGEDVLKQQLLSALSSARERNSRFDLALAGLPFLSDAAIVAALKARISFLSGIAENIKRKLEFQGGKKLPFHVQALFSHPLFLIKHEIEFTEILITQLSEKKSKES